MQLERHYIKTESLNVTTINDILPIPPPPTSVSYMRPVNVPLFGPLGVNDDVSSGDTGQPWAEDAQSQAYFLSS